jgi:hypothetical protein
MLEKIFEISPSFFWAGLTLLFGILVAKFFERISQRFFERIRINSVLKRIGVKDSLEKIGISLNAQKFFSEIVQWFFIILFLMLSFEILGLSKFADFLEKVILYFQNIFISILIFVLSSYLIDFSQKVFIGSLEKEKITYSRIFGRGFSLSIWVLTALAILYQLKIIPDLILTIFIGAIITIALVIGISFGLAGKEVAAKFLKEIEEKLK